MFMNTFLVHVDGQFQARYIELWPGSCYWRPKTGTAAHMEQLAVTGVAYVC